MSRETQNNLSTADIVAGAGADAGERRVDPHVQDPKPFEQGAEPQRLQPGASGEFRPEMEQPTAAQGQALGREQVVAPATGQSPDMAHQPEQLAALFPPEVAADFRGRWDNVQIGFVDDPRQAVQQADELVAQVMKSLAASFAEQRSRLEAGLTQGEQANTENLRMALRSYRSFFQRLLSL